MSSLQPMPLQNTEKRETVEKSQVNVVLCKDIPQDLVVQLLPRLPVKSLLRFKAVSKLWHSTISNPSFRRRCPATFIFSLRRDYDSHDHPHLYTIDKNGSYEKFPVPAFYKEYKHLKAKISNSCNGMLLLSLGPHIFLVNPSTHYFDKVLQLDGLSNWELGFTMGFCYDESIGDYKAVVILSPYTDNRAVLVASLKEKQWTRLPFLEDFDLFTQIPLVVNDRLHWIVHRYNSSTITYFNPIKNVFGKLACPRPKTEYGDSVVGLGALKGCLCIARKTCVNVFERVVEVVIMKEYGVAESWTTLFVMENVVSLSNSRRMNPLFTTDDGNILIGTEYNIWRYNLANKCYITTDKNHNTRIDTVTIEENLFLPARA